MSNEAVTLPKNPFFPRSDWGVGHGWETAAEEEKNSTETLLCNYPNSTAKLRIFSGLGLQHNLLTLP